MKRTKEGTTLVKTDTNRRDFLKKFALGAAYAVPVMTTFSLDSVRSKARASGNYGNPRVIAFRTRNAAGNAVLDPRAQNGGPEAYFEIVWDRSMDKAFNRAKTCEKLPLPSECIPDLMAAPPQSQRVAGCGDCFEPWTWNGAGTMETSPIYGSIAIRLTINGPDCVNPVVEVKKYRDLDGIIADRFEGTASWCLIPA
jgi:hypothetical protein